MSDSEGDSGTTVVRYEPRGAAVELLKARETEVLACGLAGTGKTLAMLFKAHMTCMLVPKLRALLVRDTAVSLTATTLVTFEKDVVAASLANGEVKWFGGSVRQPPAYRYANGSTLTVGGLDKPEKFLSAEFDRIFVDEATDTTLSAIETLITRLRGTAPTYKQILMACNPAHPSHFLKRRVDDGVLRMITSRHVDNPAYVNADGSYTERGRAYLAVLDKLTGVRRLRYLEGRWAAAEGVVYEGWDDAVHLIERFEPPVSWRRIWSVDFGFVHPFVWQDWAVDPDGRLILVREIYMTQRLVEDHARQIRGLAGLGPLKDGREQPYDGPERAPWERVRPSIVLCDHDAEDRATLERHLGWGTVAATKNVSEGIQALAARLKVQPDGRPRFMIMKDARVERDSSLADKGHPTSTAEEIPGYIWMDHKTKDEPVKEKDDGSDTARYAVAELDLRGPTNVRWG